MIRVGTDIVSIERIEGSIRRFGKRFYARLLSEEESALLNSTPSSIAGYWAAKEAISKALGCGIGSSLSFVDIHIYKESFGAPAFTLSEEARKRFDIVSSSISISHDGGFAIAVAIIETR